MDGYYDVIFWCLRICVGIIQYKYSNLIMKHDNYWVARTCHVRNTDWLFLRERQYKCSFKRQSFVRVVKCYLEPCTEETHAGPWSQGALIVNSFIRVHLIYRRYHEGPWDIEKVKGLVIYIYEHIVMKI